MSSVTRQRKKAKRNAKRAQKIAWLVELRLMGHNQMTLDYIRNAGNYANAKWQYETYSGIKPSDMERPLRTSKRVDPFNFIQT